MLLPTFGPVNLPALAGDKSDNMLSSSYNPGGVGLDMIHSVTRAMGFSFFASLFSGGPLANTNFYEGLKLFVVGTIIETGRRFCCWAFERFKIRYCITAQFDEGDPAYEWLVNYLTQKNIWRRSREFLVSAKSSQLRWGIKLRSTESAEYVPKYNQPHLFKWKGYWVEIQRVVKPVDQLSAVYSGQPAVTSCSMLLTMYTLSIDALSNLVEEARLHYIEGRRPHVIVHGIDLSQGNTWNVVKRKNRRPLESIILPDGLLESIVQDVKDFLQTEEWYLRAGIPYRRGYLLYGPPGTGKTSTIYALAGELGLEIYSLSLSSGFVDDNILQRAVSGLPKHSIFLLEDIDCAFPSREEEDEAGEQDRLPYARGGATTGRFGRNFLWTAPKSVVTGVTMSGLLNVLDGVGSEDGKLFFATTNYIDRLDPALIRPGRIDKKVEYKLATKSQAVALFNRFYLQDECHLPSYAVKSDLRMQLTPPDSPRPVHPPKLPEGSSDVTAANPAVMSMLSTDRQSLSSAFASYIPEEEFTTAELQGYLLLHRKNPQEALQCVSQWIKEEMAEKKRRAAAKSGAIGGKEDKMGVVIPEAAKSERWGLEEKQTEGFLHDI
ncbi:hypothetical protein AX17_003802 [Amanita inopinata Kibby_2008]|nr:hypothetical protein AX17_003802 [Amanita inopinata Kibby_2008]